MTILEFLLALAVATYGMVGGSLINASITAPKNAKKILVFFTHKNLSLLMVVEIFIGVAVIAAGELTGLYSAVPSGLLEGNLIYWLALVHFLFEALIYFCRWIVGVVDA